MSRPQTTANRRTEPALDALDHAIRALRVEEIKHRPPRKKLEPLTPRQQLANFLALADASGGLNRHDIALLRARGWDVNDDGEVTA